MGVSLAGSVVKKLLICLFHLLDSKNLRCVLDYVKEFYLFDDSYLLEL